MSDDLLEALGQRQRDEAQAADDEAPTGELFSPFDPGELDDLVLGIEARLDTPENQDESASEAGGEAHDLDTRRPKRAPLALLMTIAAAAALALWWGFGREGSDGSDALVTSIPSYSLTKATGGVATQRGDDSLPLELSLDDSLDWIATPAEPITEPLALALVATSSEGQRRFVAELPGQITDEGVVRIQARLGALIELEPGTWTLRLLIAPPGSLPEDLAGLDAGGAWRSVELPIRVRADG